MGVLEPARHAKFREAIEDGNFLIQFAEIFWATKDVATEKKISPYPPNMPVICPKLEDA